VKTRFDSQFSRMNSQIFSIGLISGDLSYAGMWVMTV
jgi:hypothetical protein